MPNRGIPSRFASDIAPPEALSARIRASVEATPASTSSTRRRVAVAMTVIPAVTAAVVLIASQLVYRRLAAGLADGTQSPSHLVLVLFVFAGVTLAATLVAVRRGSRGLGSGVVSLVLVAALGTPICAAVTLASPLHFQGVAASSLVSPWGLRCLAVVTAVGAVVLAAFAIALRRSVPVASGLRGAALGAAAGACAGLGVFFFCPGGGLKHLLVGHVLPLVALTLVASVVLPRA